MSKIISAFLRLPLNTTGDSMGSVRYAAGYAEAIPTTQKKAATCAAFGWKKERPRL
jgi:hypothetical protein